MAVRRPLGTRKRALRVTRRPCSAFSSAVLALACAFRASACARFASLRRSAVVPRALGGLPGVRLGGLRALLRVLDRALGRVELPPRVPLVRAGNGERLPVGARRWGALAEPLLAEPFLAAPFLAGRFVGGLRAPAVAPAIAPKPPIASRSLISRPARSSSAVSSSSAAACSVSAIFSRRPVPRSPASLAIVAASDGELRHQVALAGGGLLEAGAVAAGQELLLRRAQVLARRQQLVEVLPPAAGSWFRPTPPRSACAAP